MMSPNKTLRTIQCIAFDKEGKRSSFQVGTYLNEKSNLSLLDLNTVIE